MRIFEGIGVTMVLVYLAAILGGLIGWVMNIVAVVHGCSGPLTSEMIIRIIGIPVFVLGAIMGWIS